MLVDAATALPSPRRAIVTLRPEAVTVKVPSSSSATDEGLESVPVGGRGGSGQVG
jgi:hypothetical protein